MSLIDRFNRMTEDNDPTWPNLISYLIVSVVLLVGGTIGSLFVIVALCVFLASLPGPFVAFVGIAIVVWAFVHFWRVTR